MADDTIAGPWQLASEAPGRAALMHWAVITRRDREPGGAEALGIRVTGWLRTRMNSEACDSWGIWNGRRAYEQHLRWEVVLVLVTPSGDRIRWSQGEPIARGQAREHALLGLQGQCLLSDHTGVGLGVREIGMSWRYAVGPVSCCG